MNRKDFKKKLKNINSNQKKFSKITGYGYSTVKGWETTPRWVGIVISYMELAYNIGTLDQAVSTLEDLKQKVQELDYVNK